jgi:hypothetical protein
VFFKREMSLHAAMDAAKRVTDPVYVDMLEQFPMQLVDFLN